jgi:hypothetical protein
LLEFYLVRVISLRFYSLAVVGMNLTTSELGLSSHPEGTNVELQGVLSLALFSKRS